MFSMQLEDNKKIGLLGFPSVEDEGIVLFCKEWHAG